MDLHGHAIMDWLSLVIEFTPADCRVSTAERDSSTILLVSIDTLVAHSAQDLVMN